MTLGGEPRVLDVAVSPFPGAPDGSPARVWVLSDATELARLEKSLAERDRLSALSNLSAGVAHEVNTPLTGVASFARLLLDETAADDPRRPIVEKIERQAFRAARLVGSLLDLARGRPREMAPLEPAALVREACRALEDEVKGRRVTLDVDLPASLPRVLGHGDALVQVLVNLLKNALDAVSLPKEGRSGPGLVRIAVAAAGGSVLFAVDDDGPGLTREDAGEGLRAVPHDEGASGRRGAGPGDRGGYHPRARRLALGRVHPGAGRPVHGESPRSDMKVLIVDDEPVVREVLRTVLSRAGYDTSEAATAGEGLALFADPAVDLVLLDLMLPDRPGLSLLAEMRQKRPDVPVVVVTAYSSVESAITAMKEGAFHYVPKPFRNEEVVHLVAQALEKKRLVAENRALKARLDAGNDFPEMVGRSAPMEKVFQTIRQAAPARSTILVTGESGTGKELVARALHRLSLRASGPFVTVHSGALPPDLLESNLFGHTKGAFTGAVAEKKGLFKVADGGTIFFDEIGTVPLETQAKLLRVLQEREFLPVGAVEPIHSDVRVVAATNADLGRLVEEGKFREDLFYRLCVITIGLPPLRERKEDIPLLVDALVSRAARENERPVPPVTPEAMKALLDHDWPGNVRELENVLERAVVLGPGLIDLDQLPDAVRRSVPRPEALPAEGLVFYEAVAKYEKNLLAAAMHRAGGVQKEAARLLDLSPTTLNEMLKRHGMIPRRAPAHGRDRARVRLLLAALLALSPAALGAAPDDPVFSTRGGPSGPVLAETERDPKVPPSGRRPRPPDRRRPDAARRPRPLRARPRGRLAARLGRHLRHDARGARAPPRRRLEPGEPRAPRRHRGRPEEPRRPAGDLARGGPRRRRAFARRRLDRLRHPRQRDRGTRGLRRPPLHPRRLARDRDRGAPLLARRRRRPVRQPRRARAARLLLALRRGRRARPRPARPRERAAVARPDGRTTSASTSTGTGPGPRSPRRAPASPRSARSRRRSTSTSTRWGPSRATSSRLRPSPSTRASPRRPGSGSRPSGRRTPRPSTPAAGASSTARSSTSSTPPTATPGPPSAAWSG